MLMIIDMNNLCHRVFHTPQGELTTKAGEPSGVMLGVINSIKGYLERFPEVEKVLACFDGGKSAWRKALYPGYKAQRDYGKDDPEKAKRYKGLWAQIDELVKFLPLLGINTVRVDKQEADDDIAATCRLYPNEHKLIISGDKDMFQLVDANTSIYYPPKDTIVSPLNFYEMTGVTQPAYIGYRSLIGDTSDNIIGIDGIGEKTAKNLMDKYGHIDNVLNATGKDKDKLMKSKRTQKIFEPQNQQILGRNNKLMSFKYIEFDKLECPVRAAVEQDLMADSKAVREWLMRWQFVSILSNYVCWILPFKALGQLN